MIVAIPEGFQQLAAGLALLFLSIVGLYFYLSEVLAEREVNHLKIRVSERKYRLLFDNMTFGFALLEMPYDDAGNPSDYRFLALIPAFTRLTGLSFSEAVGKTVK